MKRKAGYYWVKYPNRDEWSIEYWNGGMWFTRSPTLLNDKDFTEIDETPIVREQNTPTSEEQFATPAVSKCVEPVSEPTVCVHPIPQRTYVGRGWLKCGVCGEEFQ